MIEDDEEVGGGDEGGGAGWLATFADLMSLLMCFFVLLLSFSEMDATKFKAASGSIKDAFGVQNVEFLIDRPSSFSTYDEEFGKGDKEIEKQFFSDTKVALQFNSFCERESYSSEKEKIELETDVIKVMSKLQEILKFPIEQKQVFLSRKDLSLTLSLNEEQIFQKDGSEFSSAVSLPWQKIFKEIRPWLGAVQFKTFGDLNRRNELQDWGLSFSRSLRLASLFRDKGGIALNKIQMGAVALKFSNIQDQRRSPASQRFDKSLDIVIRMTYPKEALFEN